MSKSETLAEMVKNARKEKGISARELAKLCDISHTEINNIESGIRIKPALLTLKGFEKYLDLDFQTVARLVGYSKETIEYADKNIIVSYEKFDEKVNYYKEEKKRLLYEIDKRRHLGLDIKDNFDKIYKYLNSQDDINKDILMYADNINTYLNVLIQTYDER